MWWSFGFYKRRRCFFRISKPISFENFFALWSSIFVDWKQIPPFSCRIHQRHLACKIVYRGADKSLAQPGRKQARNYVRDARDFNNIETRAVIKFFFLFPARQGAEGNSRHFDTNISLFPSWSGSGLISTPVTFIRKKVSIKIWKGFSLAILIIILTLWRRIFFFNFSTPCI